MRMTTYQTRQHAAEQKLIREQLQANRFVKLVVSRLFAHIIDDSDYSEPIAITARQVQDEFGKAGRECFVLMFRLLQRGGMNKDGKGYPTKWVANKASLPAYEQWLTQTPEALQTCRSLAKALVAGGVFREEWHKPQQTWLDSNIRKAATVSRRAHEKILRDLQKTKDYEYDTATYF